MRLNAMSFHFSTSLNFVACFLFQNSVLFAAFIEKHIPLDLKRHEKRKKCIIKVTTNLMYLQLLGPKTHKSFYVGGSGFSSIRKQDDGGGTTTSKAANNVVFTYSYYCY
jgi:hypothetical protein